MSKHRSRVTEASKATSRVRSVPTRPVAAHIGNDVAPLVERVVAIVEDARSQVVRTVNSAMVISYWHIGRELVEFVQRGAARAEYGDQVIELLAQRLQARVGRGYSSTNLKYFRIFYQVYAARAPVIRHEARDESGGSRCGSNQAWVSDQASYHGWLIKSDLETSATSFLGWWTVDGATANSNASLQPILHVEWH